MAILSPSFVFGVFVLVYLASFLFFAVLRILTGISIQRIGVSGLRRLAYTPKDGIRVEIRGLGLNLHRPTFAQPTWISVVIDELAVTVDIEAVEGRKKKEEDEDASDQDGSDCDKECKEPKDIPIHGPQTKAEAEAEEKDPNRHWDAVIKMKEKLKRLHRSIGWLRLVDIVMTNSSLTILEVGTIQVGSFTIAVDTRRKLVDQGHIFTRMKQGKKKDSPVEWITTVRSVLLTADGCESLEVLDQAALNIHGYLYKDEEGLREAEVELKLGRIHIPLDDLRTAVEALKKQTKSIQKPVYNTGESEQLTVPQQPLVTDIKVAGGEESPDLTSKESFDLFLTSLLRGIKEVHFAVSHIGVSQKIDTIQPNGIPLYFNAVMKEVGIDVHRLDPKSPAHRMYFSSQTVAHEALLAALSIAIGVDDGHGKSDRLVYIPMATTTIRTTLPAKLVEYHREQSADERNASILNANMVVTSPSVDLDPKHLPLIVALLQPKPRSKARSVQGSREIISKYLPKANIKFSMHEPVFRIALPTVEQGVDDDECDLVISSISSVSLDLDSSHSGEGDTNYALGAIFRVQSHDLYYQTCKGVRFDLLQTDFMELKFNLNATPKVSVVATGNLQTFSVRLVRPELSAGVREIVRQLRSNVEPDVKVHPRTSRDVNLVRALPPWLVNFQFQASNFSIEVAGVDTDISEDIRGVAFQLDSWAVEYRAQKSEFTHRRSSRRRAGSRSLTPEPSMRQLARDDRLLSTDGRRLSLNARGFEAYVIETHETWEPEPFLALPRLEVAAVTSSDSQGAILHISSYIKTVLIQYSLYRHYAIGVAATVITKAFVRSKADVDAAMSKQRHSKTPEGDNFLSPMRHVPIDQQREFPDQKSIANELVTMDVRIMLFQVKANMPSDPPMMLQIYGVEVGRHRYSAPFFVTALTRLYVEDPKLKRIWVRLVSIKSCKVDLRHGRHATSARVFDEEQLIDVQMEAIRLAVPHQVVLHKVFDNVVNTVKAIEQLHHRFKTGTNEYILEKHPEGPKHVPKISLRSNALLFEIEDGAFEWKLGNIYRAGLLEQKQRLAREEAFRVKARKIEEEEAKRDTRTRARSAHPRARSTKEPSATHKRSRSEDFGGGRRGRSRSRGRYHRMRYDPEGLAGVSASAKIPIQQALERLQQYNAQSWKRRIDQSYNVQMNSMKELRGVFWGADELPDDVEDTEDILEVPQRPGLMSTLISDLHISLDKPSFPLTELSEFMHRVGKGMPHDMKYSLLIPMHVRLDMGEARLSLRDYPLPLVHVPAMKPSQSSRVPSWSLTTDFVIAEEFRGNQSIRHVKVAIVPPSHTTPDKPANRGFSIDVRRTVSPVKTYSDMNVDINTGFPTRITWGASYQPAIQDMMMVIEGFTKPQIDPSDRAGFWDKIRLSFHSRLLVSWKGDGDVHLLLKGTRDPYSVTGNGAGFMMCWRNDVVWSLWRENDPKKFMTVDSGDYILAIPDYSQQALALGPCGDSNMNAEHYKKGAIFKKVIMKLSGNVQWLAGLVFERNIVGGKRSFDFIPHYDVILREPKYAKAPPGEEYDAFRGFRSNHIHLSVAVSAPRDRKWAIKNVEPSMSYNSVHLTPRFFTHFFAWWSMFGGTMSLPIRQGRLWPGVEKSSKKFGRHLATIKYSILLAPLFLSHVYKHKEDQDASSDVVAVTGIKIRLDSFMLDIHQRREWFNTLVSDKSKKTPAQTTGMKIYKAQLDLVSADVRALSATVAGTTAESLSKATVPIAMANRHMSRPDVSQFVIPDNDFDWIDMDDFVELDWMIPSECNPETKIIPLAYAPGFSYFRDTDHGNTINGDPDRSSPFGNEPTHFCVMSKDDDPRKVQCHLIRQRLEQLDEQVDEHKRKMGQVELRNVQAIESDPEAKEVQEELDQMRNYENVLKGKKKFLRERLHDMEERIKNNRTLFVGELEDEACSLNGRPRSVQSPSPDHPEVALTDFVTDFNNRFVIHNIQLKWNNSLRNTMLRYIHQVSQRRGFVYYQSRRAVKFILDIVEEQNKAKKANGKPATPPSPRPGSAPSRSTTFENEQDEYEAECDIQERINELLADSKKFVNANDPEHFDEVGRPSVEQLAQNIGKDFVPQNSYHLRLIAPQIQLQSDKNPQSVALLTAQGMELKVVEVMDKDRLFDDVSGLVQRRFSVEMDGTQFFVTHKSLFNSPLLKLYSGSHYGTRAGSAWPPWVPMEVMFDFEVDPFGFKRIIQKTSASLRYDKYNTLRLKYNDEVDKKDAAAKDSLDSRMDHLWVQFPQVKAICDSKQYYTMYIIVLDLLLYNEPMEKTRSEKLEKIMLASDFSDLRGAPEMVIKLQERIRQLEEIKMHFQIHSHFLDQKGWEDRISLDKDLTACEDELFFMMKAITTSQRKYDSTATNGLLRWNIASEQIVWHLMRDKDHPLVEFQLQNAEYDRTDISDGSHVNLMQIDKIIGLNLLPNAIYPEMVAPYIDPERKTGDGEKTTQMLRVYWNMLEAVAGIPIMEHFEVNLHPMKIQLEHEVSRKLFEYIFPGSNEKPAGHIKGSSGILKHIPPPQAVDSDLNELADASSSNHTLVTPELGNEPDDGNRAGSLELRLRPTLNSESRPKTAISQKGKHGFHRGDETFRLFQPNKSHGDKGPGKLKRRPSLESMTSSQFSRPMRTNTEISKNHSNDSKRRFAISRNGKVNKNKPSDDLTQMLNRASNYMTLAYVKVPSVAISLSYKGKGEHNIEDLHDFVFRLPTLEYRNKTWSNLDLVLALKKDFTRAVIDHTGSIIANKFTQRRPTEKERQRLRDQAVSQVLLVPGNKEGIKEFGDANESILDGPLDRQASSALTDREFADPNPYHHRRSFGSYQSQSGGSSLRPNSAHSSGGASGLSYGYGRQLQPSLRINRTKSRETKMTGGTDGGYGADTERVSADSYSFRGRGMSANALGVQTEIRAGNSRNGSGNSSSVEANGGKMERSKSFLGNGLGRKMLGLGPKKKKEKEGMESGNASASGSMRPPQSSPASLYSGGRGLEPGDGGGGEHNGSGADEGHLRRLFSRGDKL